MLTRQIVYKYKELDKEVSDLSKALDEMDGELNFNSLPVKLLKKAYEDKRKELNVYCQLEWEEK